MSSRIADPRIFLHANGFPAGTYRRFLDELERDGPVLAPAVISTPVALSAQQRWPAMVERVAGLIRETASARGPVALVGHSMGGYLSLMAAASMPEQVRRIVLVDSPLALGWRAPLFEIMRTLGMTRRGGPAPIAARRREQWASDADAHAHFSGKDFVQRWAPGVLDDYVAHGLQAGPDGSRSLLIGRQVESDIYAQLPAAAACRAYRALRAGGCEIYMLSGAQSREMDMAGRAANRALFGDRWVELPSGHLVPLECPQACATAVAECLALD